MDFTLDFSLLFYLSFSFLTFLSTISLLITIFRFIISEQGIAAECLGSTLLGERQTEDSSHSGSGTKSQEETTISMARGGPLTGLGSSPRALPLKILLHCDFPIPTVDSPPGPEPTEPSTSRRPRPTKEPSTPNANRSSDVCSSDLGTDRDATGSIWTGSTTSSPKGSLGRSEGSRRAGKQRVSLVEIVSQITKRTESALVIPQGDLLRRAVELLLLANPRGTSGRLVETAVGPNSSWRLELTVPLSDEDGETWMALLVPDRAESPQWEQGSHNEEGF